MLPGLFEAQKPTKKNYCRTGTAPQPARRQRSPARRPLTGELLDLGLLESDVLLGDGIVFLEAEFVGLGACVFLGYVEIARVGTRLEFDLDHVALGHNTISLGSSNALLAVFAL
jgi:hypothetical protein